MELSQSLHLYVELVGVPFPWQICVWASASNCTVTCSSLSRAPRQGRTVCDCDNNAVLSQEMKSGRSSGLLQPRGLYIILQTKC